MALPDPVRSAIELQIASKGNGIGHEEESIEAARRAIQLREERLQEAKVELRQLKDYLVRDEQAERKDVLHHYSEWLDSEQKLIRSEEETGDKRSHDDLVREFLASIEGMD